MDKGWHHVCWKWGNSNGYWAIFLDGTRLKYGQGHATGVTIPAKGKFSFGNALFVDKISNLNAWSRRLSAEVIIALSKGCSSVVGDAVQWSGFRSGITGPITIVENAACTLPSKYISIV